MLRQRMNAHDDMRTPFLEDITRIGKAFAMQEAALLRTHLVDRPIEILHPMLLVLKDPVIDVHQTLGDAVRVLDRTYRADRDRIAAPKSLKSIRNGLSRRTVAAARVGRDY